MAYVLKRKTKPSIKDLVLKETSLVLKKEGENKRERRVIATVFEDSREFCPCLLVWVSAQGLSQACESFIANFQASPLVYLSQ